MHRSGAQLVRYALEQLNTEQTFGVVGDLNRAIYSELQQSSIHTHLVNQEISAAFMADAISRNGHDPVHLARLQAQYDAHARALTQLGTPVPALLAAPALQQAA